MLSRLSNAQGTHDVRGAAGAVTLTRLFCAASLASSARAWAKRESISVWARPPRSDMSHHRTRALLTWHALRCADEADVQTCALVWCHTGAATGRTRATWHGAAPVQLALPRGMLPGTQFDALRSGDTARRAVLRHLLPEGDARRLPSAANDPAAYMAWLERQLDATTAACAATHALETRVEALTQLCARSEERLLALARLVKLQAQSLDDQASAHQRVVSALQRRVSTLEQIVGGDSPDGRGHTARDGPPGAETALWPPHGARLAVYEEHPQSSDLDAMVTSLLDAETKRRRVLSVYADLAGRGL